MPAIPTYLMCRNGIWYFSYRIPNFLRKRYNIKKVFIRRSLRTHDVHEAILRSKKYSWLIMGKKKKTTERKKNLDCNDNEIIQQMSNLDDLEAQIELYDDALLIGRQIVAEYENVNKNGTYAEKTEFWMSYSQYEYNCYRLALDNIHKETQEREGKEQEQIGEKAKFFAKKFNDNVHLQASQKNEQKNNSETSITLNELIEKFIEYKTSDGAWKQRTIKLQKGRLNLIKEFLEYAIGIENPMIHLFTSEHAIQFEEEFCHYPKNAKKHFPDMSLAEIMSRIDSVEFEKVDRISTNNYNEYAQLLMALFKWAKNDKKRKYLKGENVFVDLKKTGEPPKSYSPFTVGEIKRFFSTDLFCKKDFETQFAWRYWIPIIMLYHGMRLEEVAQLLIKNIVKKDDVWCFDIREEIDKQGRILTTTKKRGKQTGERIVPIHRKVIKIGFLDYVEFQRQKGNLKVFPSLKNIDKKGNYKQAGSSVTSWFNEDSKTQGKTSYFSRIGIDKKQRNLVLYSFKHSAETLLINHPDKIEHDKIDTVIGHLIRSTGRKHYGQYSQKTLLEDVVEKIDYPEAKLPWDVNEEYNKISFPWEENNE